MDGVSCFACAYCPFLSDNPDYLEYHTRLKHLDTDIRNGLPNSDSKVISESTSPIGGGEDDSFHVPDFTDDLVKKDLSVSETKQNIDICLPVMTSNTVSDDKDVKFSDFKIQEKNVPNMISNIIPSSSGDCCDTEVEKVHCFHCSYSSVFMAEVKFHHFSQHPLKSACALDIHGSERNITFFCVKETCEYSTTVCNAYEKHLMGCLNINERLSDALKERLHSSIAFVLDFHKRHDLEVSPEFEDFVSSFIGLHVSVDSCSSSLSSCIKKVKEGHLDPYALNTCASISQYLGKEMKLENDNNCHVQASTSEVENKTHQNLNESSYLFSTSTIKRENIDHLISGYPDLGNDIADDLSCNADGNFFSRETQYDPMKSEEISNSKLDAIDENLGKEMKLENDNNCHDQVSVSEVENKSDQDMNESLYSTFTSTIKRENIAANSLVDHLVSENPDLENDIACDFSSNVDGYFFSKETKYDPMKSEEISNSKLDAIDENRPSPTPRPITKGLVSPTVQTEDLHSCHLCDLGFPSKTLLEKHSRMSHCEDWQFGHGTTYGPRKNCLNEKTDKICLSNADVHVEVTPQNKEQITKDCGQVFHNPKHKGNKFICSICSKVFYHNKCNFVAHMRTHTGEKPFKCKECGQTFREKGTLNKHMRTHTGERPFKCKKCGQTFRQKSALNRHMRTHTGEKPFKCIECGQTFREKGHLNKHMRTHTREKPFKCKECGQAFGIKDSLNGHMRTHTGEKPFKCKECGQTFSHKSNFNVHMRSHTGEKPFKCKECGQTFRETGALKKHMRSHTGEKPFKCKECGQTFREKGDLNKHMRTHTGEKPFKCKECGQTFREKGTLNGHMRTHTGEKPFKCKECGQAFSHKSTLNGHMRTHTGEKPFKCKECGQTFREKGTLNGHMRTHTGEKPFKCRECGQTFSHKSTLNGHMRTHTGEKPFKCNECGQIFRHKNNLNGHMRTHTHVKPIKM